MIQSCQIYFNLSCEKTYKNDIIKWLKNYFSDIKHRNIYLNPISRLEIIDEDELIVIDVEVNIQCAYIAGYSGTRWEPPEPSYVEGYFNDSDFIWWIEDILATSPYGTIVDVEIDNDSFIPDEEFLIRDFEERVMEDYYAEH